MELLRLPFLLFFLSLSVWPSFSLTSEAWAAETVGKITSAEGRVDILRGGALPAIAAKTGDPVFLKDIIRTKSNSRAEILFSDGAVLKLAQRSRIDISEYVSETRGLIKLPRGRVQAIVPPKFAKGTADPQKAQRFEIHTPNAVAGVRGTDYIVFHDKYSSGVVVKDGVVYVYNPMFPDVVTVVYGGTSIVVPIDGPPYVPAGGTEPVEFRFESSGSAGSDPQLPVTPPPTPPSKQGDFQRLD